MPIDLWNLLLTVIVSAAVAWFSGDRWVDINHRRREHSLTIVNESFQEWVNQITSISPTGTTINDSNEVIGFKLEKFDALPFNEDLEEHLTTGYPEITTMWNSYQRHVEAHNELLAEVQQKINEEFKRLADSLNLETYYANQKRHRPIFAMNPWRVTLALTQEYKRKLQGYEYWHSGKPTRGDIQSGDVKYFRLILLNNELVTHDRIDIIESIERLFIELIESEKYSDDVLKVFRAKQKLDEETESIRNSLSRIIETVKLGHDLKGRCSNCISRMQI